VKVLITITMFVLVTMGTGGFLGLWAQSFCACQDMPGCCLDSSCCKDAGARSNGNFYQNRTCNVSGVGQAICWTSDCTNTNNVTSCDSCVARNTPDYVDQCMYGAYGNCPCS
jgi:hypothetical protein